jgi:pyruvate/2-oxoglutarate dehydrogenase complex dihydrolipoamide dehydrogenase (E3) component
VSVVTEEFDVVVIGAGPAGEVAAGRLGEAGLDVAIVEEHLVGGECSYYACMPSKALLRPGELLAEASRVPGAREAISGTLDVEAVLARRDEVIHDLDDSIQLPWLEQRRVTLVRGRGRLEGERRVRVGERLLEARLAVIVATGSGAAVPPIPGLRETGHWTNREATTAKVVPARLVILGGGVVGVEMAQAWSSLGSQVTLIEMLPRLLPREEAFASAQVAEALRDRGVDVRTGAKAAAVRREGDEVIVTLADGEDVRGDELLVAVGRRPHTSDLGLETIELEPGRFIEVDDAMRALGFEWLYAVGDVNGRVLLTHMGKYQARIAAEHILGRDVHVGDHAHGALSPRVVFSDPQVAAVGHTLESAQESGLRVRAIDQPTSGNAGGSFYGRNATGTARLVIDEDRQVLVGATFTGAEVAEFVHAATIAIVGELTIDELWHAVPSFPTRSEVWLRLLETYEAELRDDGERVPVLPRSALLARTR